MNSKHHRKPLQPETPKFRRPPGSPSKNQLRALANVEAQAHAARWKTLVPIAGSTWSKLHPTELARSNGDINVLAGLLQMRYQIGRQDADSQVTAFFEQHSPKAAASDQATPPAAHTTAIPA